MASAAALRCRILAECARSPWNDAAATSIESAAITDLRRLQQGISAALEALALAVETTRETLAGRVSAYSAALAGEPDLNPDEVEARLARLGAAHAERLAEVDRIEALKKTALEQEAVAVDAALEATESDLAALRARVVSMDDASIKDEAPALLIRAHEVASRLCALPHAVVESPSLRVDFSNASPIDPAAWLGTLHTERSVSDLHLRIRQGHDELLRVKPGALISTDLELDEGSGGSDAEVVAVAVAHQGTGDDARLLSLALPHVRLVIDLEYAPTFSSPCRLPAAISLVNIATSGNAGRWGTHSATLARTCLRASFRVPGDAPAGASLRVLDFSIAGRPVKGCKRRFSDAVAVSAARGAVAPQIVHATFPASAAPRPICIDADAILYVPGGTQATATPAGVDPPPPLRAFRLCSGGGETAPRCALPALASLDAREPARIPAQPTRVLAAVAEDDSRDMIFYLTTLGVFAMALEDPFWAAWHAETPVGGTAACVAALPGALFATNGQSVSAYQNRADAHPLSQGYRLAWFRVPGASFIAADVASGVLFVSSRLDTPEVPEAGWQASSAAARSARTHAVLQFRWHGEKLVRLGPVAALGMAAASRPLAVVPPSRGDPSAYLVAGTLGTPAVTVLRLPGLELVFEGALSRLGGEGGDPRAPAIVGLAADALGRALAVADGATGDVDVHTWPLGSAVVPTSASAAGAAPQPCSCTVA